MRATFFTALLVTAFMATPSFARPGDRNRRPPGDGPRAQRGGEVHRGDDRRDGGKQEDNDVDLSPWIQAWAREGIKGKALTQRLEKLMDLQRAGRVPAATPGGRERESERRAVGRPQGRGGFGFGPGPGRFGGPQGPGMRGGGRPEMPGGPGMMRGGGPGMRGGPGMMRGGGGRPPQPQKDVQPKSGPQAGSNQAPATNSNADALRDVKAQLGKMREELNKLERRLESSSNAKPEKGDGDKPKKPKNPDGDGER